MMCSKFKCQKNKSILKHHAISKSDVSVDVTADLLLIYQTQNQDQRNIKRQTRNEDCSNQKLTTGSDVPFEAKAPAHV